MISTDIDIKSLVCIICTQSSCFQSTSEQKKAAQAELKEAIAELKKSCNDHLAAKVVGTYVDITGPIMELQAAALAPLGM